MTTELGGKRWRSPTDEALLGLEGTGVLRVEWTRQVPRAFLDSGEDVEAALVFFSVFPRK